MRTEALVLAEKDAPFVLQEVELDEPQPNEVLVKVNAWLRSGLVLSCAALMSLSCSRLWRAGCATLTSRFNTVRPPSRAFPASTSRLTSHPPHLSQNPPPSPPLADPSPLPSFPGAFPSPFPTIAGHEGAGTVLSIGSAVTRVQPGDSVLLSFSSCQACGHCADGHPAACATWTEHNFGRFRNDAVGTAPVVKSVGGEGIAASFFGQSAFARHAVVMESSCVRVPEGTDLKMLAPLGCGLQTG